MRISELGDAGLPRMAAKLHEADRGYLTPCWVGDIYQDRDGYAIVTFGGRPSQRAHRLAYSRLVGEIPDGLQLDHLCRVRNCVNPDHLETVTSAENTFRGDGLAARNRRKTHCDHGHEFTPANTLPRTDGVRRCRECHQLWRREYNARRREARREQVPA